MARNIGGKYQHGYVSPEENISEAKRYTAWVRERAARQMGKKGRAWVTHFHDVPADLAPIMPDVAKEVA